MRDSLEKIDKNVGHWYAISNKINNNKIRFIRWSGKIKAIS